MNVDRMLMLAEELERPVVLPNEVEFHMNASCNRDINVGDPVPCGTLCCIAGLACLMFGEKGSLISCGNAAELLGLRIERSDDNYSQEDRLFFNYGGYVGGSFESITRKDAAAAIRRMVAEEASV